MSFVAQITADISNFDKNIKKATDIADSSTKKMQAQFDKLGDSFIKVGKGASIFSGAVLAGTTAIAMFAKKTGDMANDLLSATVALDSSADMLQEYKLISIEAGTNTEAFSSAVEALTRRLKEVGGEGDDTTDYIDALGVSLLDTSGQMRRTGAITNDIIKSLASMENVSQRNVIASQLFGRQWVSIAPILGLGADGIEQVRARSHELGVVLSGEALDAANKFSISMNVIDLRLTAVKDNLASKLAPLLSETIVPIIENRVIPALTNFGEKLGDIVDRFNELPQPTKEFILGVTGIAVAAGPVLIALGGILKILPLIKTAIIAMTSPIGLIVGAIVAGTALIITHWDEIKTASNNVVEYVKDDWERLKESLEVTNSSIGKLMKGDFNGWMDDVKKSFNLTVDYLKNRWAQLKGIFKDSDEGIGNAAAGMMAGAIGPAIDAVDELTESVDELTTSGGDLTEALDIFQSGTISEAIRATSKRIKSLGDYLKDLRAGKVIIENVHDEIVRVEERLNVLNTALDALTGGRELNIKVNTDSALDLFRSTDFGSEAGLVVPVLPKIDTSLLKDGMGDLSEGIKVLAIDMTSMVTDIIDSAFSGIADAIANKENVVASLGASLLAPLGSILSQLGKMLITTGAGFEALQKMFANPFGGGLGAIAVGVALMALGAAAKAGASAIMANQSKSSSYSSAPSLKNTSPSYAPSEYRGAYQDDFKVEFKIGSNELVGVLDTAEQRRNRL